MENLIENKEKEIKPAFKIYTAENSPLIKRKVDEANEMLRTVGLPKFKFIVEK